MADVPSTITIKFLKPRKLGATSESWLRQDVLGFECTAATCLYFFFNRVGRGSRGCNFWGDPLRRLPCERPDRLIGASAGLSVAVTVAVSMVIVNL